MGFCIYDENLYLCIRFFEYACPKGRPRELDEPKSFVNKGFKAFRKTEKRLYAYD
jgi:hypothetical protein